MSHPLTHEGWQVWDLVGRLGGQLRAIRVADRTAVMGWDMGAALAMAQALGIAPIATAELLPGIEGVMVRRLNAQIEDGADG